MQERFAIIRWDDEREEEQLFSAASINTPYRASMLLDEAVYEDQTDLDAAIHRSFQVFLNMQVPIQEHFKQVHVHNSEGHLEDDWALSEIAFYLLLLNGDVHKSAVAEAQAYAVRQIVLHH
jgi:hypothetical protein